MVDVLFVNGMDTDVDVVDAGRAPLLLVLVDFALDARGV